MLERIDEDEGLSDLEEVDGQPDGEQPNNNGEAMEREEEEDDDEAYQEAVTGQEEPRPEQQVENIEVEDQELSDD